VQVIDTDLPGVRVLAPAVHRDDRGELRAWFRDPARADAGFGPTRHVAVALPPWEQELADVFA